MGERLMIALPEYSLTRRNVVHQMDAMALLRGLPSNSIHCCVTSPPYYGLRAYGAGDGEMGSEDSPQAFVSRLVRVFAELRRVLRPDGTVWLNLGDSYAAQRGGTAMPAETLAGGVGGHGGAEAQRGRGNQYQSHRNARAIGYKHKDLMMMPHRVAIALQDDGWWVRSDICWHKPNPMPESVTDRPTKSHEYIFLLTKSAKYHYDADAIREDSVYPDDNRKSRSNSSQKYTYVGKCMRPGSTVYPKRNKRSVWTIPKPVYKLRDDLTPEKRQYVIQELMRRGWL